MVEGAKNTNSVDTNPAVRLKNILGNRLGNSLEEIASHIGGKGGSENCLDKLAAIAPDEKTETSIAPSSQFIAKNSTSTINYIG